MSSDFINGDRVPSLADKPPRNQESNPLASPGLVDSSALKWGSHTDLCNQGKVAGGDQISAPSHLGGEVISGFNGSSLRQKQGNQGNHSGLVQQQTNLDPNLGSSIPDLGFVRQNLGVYQNNSAHRSGGNQIWKPRNNPVYHNPISGVSNVNPNLVGLRPNLDNSQFLGVFSNRGSSSQIEGGSYDIQGRGTVNGCQNNIPNLGVDFPPLTAMGGVSQSNEIMLQRQEVSEMRVVTDQNENGSTDNNLDGSGNTQRPSWLNVMLRNSDQNYNATWGQILNLEKNRCALDRVDLNKIKEHYYVMPEKVVQNGSKMWKEVVVGYFFDNSFAFKFVEGYLRRKWILKGRVTINADKEMFFFRFSNAEDRKMILDEGPIFISGKVFMLREWSPNIEVEKRGCKSLPLWTKFWDMPKFLWNKEGFSHVASAIGYPLFTDSITMDMKRMGYARICIEIDSNFDFPSKIKFKSGLLEFEVEIEYEWVPPKCRNCNSFGHYFHSCKEPRKPEANKERKDMQEGTSKDKENNKVEITVTETVQGGEDVRNKSIEVEEDNIQGEANGEVDKIIDNIDVDGSDGSSLLEKGNVSKTTDSRTTDIDNLNGVEAMVEKYTDVTGKENQEVLVDKEMEDHVETEEENVNTSSMGNSSGHYQKKNKENLNIVESQNVVGTSTAEKLKKTVEGDGITRSVVTSGEKQHSVGLEPDKYINRGGRRIMGRNEVVHTQKERDNRTRTRSGTVLHRAKDDFARQFYEDSDEYDEDGASQADEDDIPIVDGEPVVFKSYPANKQFSASKVNGANANKKTVVTPCNVKEPSKVNNNAKRAKGHNHRR